MVGLTALFTGMVLALQSYTGFSRFNAEGAIATVVVLSVTRELGPVIAGLMVAGRVGAAMAAEIGTMRVTEQIDALVTLSADPLRYLVVPRLLAGLVTLPCLVGRGRHTRRLRRLPGRHLQTQLQPGQLPDADRALSRNDGRRLRPRQSRRVRLHHRADGVLSRVSFARRRRGVGQATTSAVVSASILILLFNYLLTQAFFAK